MKAPTVAQKTRAAYDALPEQQRLVLEVAFQPECSLAQEYRRFDMRNDPLAKGARWRWMHHEDLRAGLKERGFTKSPFNRTNVEWKLLLAANMQRLP